MTELIKIQQVVLITVFTSGENVNWFLENCDK